MIFTKRLRHIHNISDLSCAYENCREQRFFYSLNVRYSLLATGRFITMMPHSLLKLGAVRLPVKVLPIELPWWRYPMMIFTLKNRSVSPLAELFIDTVRELSRPLAASQVA